MGSPRVVETPAAHRLPGRGDQRQGKPAAMEREVATVWSVPSSTHRGGAVGAASAQGRAGNYSEE